VADLYVGILLLLAVVGVASIETGLVKF